MTSGSRPSFVLQSFHNKENAASLPDPKITNLMYTKTLSWSLLVSLSAHYIGNNKLQLSR